MKEIGYYALRLPGGLMGVCLLVVAFAPVSEPVEASTGELILRIGLLLLGILILIPNHLFSSSRFQKFRFYSLAMTGIVFTFFGADMIWDYLQGGKDSAMIPIALFVLYNAFALPMSALFRERLLKP